MYTAPVRDGACARLRVAPQRARAAPWRARKVSDYVRLAHLRVFSRVQNCSKDQRMGPLRSALMEGCCPARVVLRWCKRACQNVRARAQRLRHAAIACGCSLTHLQHWLDERDLEVSEVAREPQLARKRRVRKDVVGELKHLALLQEGAAQRGRGRGGTRQWRGMGEMGDGRCQLFRLSQREGAHSRKESRARGSGEAGRGRGGEGGGMARPR